MEEALTNAGILLHILSYEARKLAIHLACM
jgi:hypothetical protein